MASAAAGLLTRRHQGMAMGRIAEMGAGPGQHLGIAEGRVVDDLAAEPPRLQQLGVMAAQMAQQQRAQVAFAVAMTEQQHHLGTAHRQRDLLEIGMVDGSPLTGDVAVVAVAEVFAAGPEAMGVQHGMVNRLPLQPEQTAAVMVHHQDQAQGLVAAGANGRNGGMLRRNPDLAQQTAQALHRLDIEIPLVQPAATAVNPAAGPLGETDLQAPPLAPQLSTEGTQQGFHLGQAEAMGQGMAPEQIQGALVLSAEFRHRPTHGRNCRDADHKTGS